MEEVRTFARKAAPVKVPVLITGETGTGKSLLGRVIHLEGGGSEAPYVAVNCAGIPDSLFESEFFGHRRGAFTGAREGRRGFLEQAQGGSLFLDEVGELSVTQQAKLLTALEEGEVRRLGGEGTIRVDVRVLAATSRDLSREIRCGRFRRDLYHRLAVLTCRLPPLRDRKDDIPLLARRFLRTIQARHGWSARSMDPRSVEYLRAKEWPGNVRELSHHLEAALILSEGRVLGVEALEAAESMTQGFGTPSSNGGVAEGAGTAPSERYSFWGSQEDEKAAIREALVQAKGNKSQAAQRLGMSRNTLRLKLRKYGLA